MKLFGIDKE